MLVSSVLFANGGDRAKTNIADLWHLCVFSMVQPHSKVETATRPLPVSSIMMCNFLHNLHLITRMSYPTTVKTWFAGYSTKMSIVVWDHVEELPTSRAIHFSRLWILHCSAIYNHRLCHVCRNPMVSMRSTLERCHQRAWAWISNLIASLLTATVSLKNSIPVSTSFIILATFIYHPLIHILHSS